MKLTRSIIILFLGVANFGMAQQYCPVYIRDFELAEDSWKDLDVASSKAYWENGGLKIDYQHSHDSIWTRKEFHDNGDLKLEAEVYRTMCVDTFYFEDENLEMRIQITNWYCDILHGQYAEFSQHFDIQTVSGQFQMNTMVGEWTKSVPQGNLVVVNYSSAGLLEGEYTEYYGTIRDNRFTKWIGQFGVIEYYQPWNQLVDSTLQRVRISREVGLWTHLALNGDTLETVEYNWKKE